MHNFINVEKYRHNTDTQYKYVDREHILLKTTNYFSLWKNMGEVIWDRNFRGLIGVFIWFLTCLFFRSSYSNQVLSKTLYSPTPTSQTMLKSTALLVGRTARFTFIYLFDISDFNWRPLWPDIYRSTVHWNHRGAKLSDDKLEKCLSITQTCHKGDKLVGLYIAAITLGQGI